MPQPKDWTELIKRYRALARARYKNKQDQEDLVQEMLVNKLRYPDQYERHVFADAASRLGGEEMIKGEHVYNWEIPTDADAPVLRDLSGVAYERDFLLWDRIAAVWPLLNPRQKYAITEHILKDRKLLDVGKDMGLDRGGVLGLIQRGISLLQRNYK